MFRVARNAPQTHIMDRIFSIAWSLNFNAGWSSCGLSASKETAWNRKH